MVKLAAFSVTWYLARALFLGVECDPLSPEKLCQVVCFLLYGNQCKIQEFLFFILFFLLWKTYPSMPLTTGLLRASLKWHISESL